MKLSKYTQASTPNDNDYQNVGVTLLPDDGNQNPEFILHGYPPPDRFSPNANRFPVDIELCNCAKPVNRSFSTLPKFESTTLSQYSLDRKSKFVPRQKLTRIQSPEIINIHRGPNHVLYDGYGDESAIKPAGYDKCDEYGFRRGHPFRTSSRSVGL